MFCHVFFWRAFPPLFLCAHLAAGQEARGEVVISLHSVDFFAAATVCLRQADFFATWSLLILFTSVSVFSGFEFCIFIVGWRYAFRVSGLYSCYVCR